MLLDFGETLTKKNELFSYYSSAYTFLSIDYIDLANNLDKIKAINYVKDGYLVICNFKTHSANNLGLYFEQLSGVNSCQIYGNLIGFAV
jgi:hypothetical protein